MIEPSQWDRFKELAVRAFDVPEGERGAWLDRECGDDAALRDELERLLAIDTAGYLDVPESGDPPGDTIPETYRTLGGFRLMRRIGRGGMGEVYLAEQAARSRVVALNVLVGDAQHPDKIVRFEREARAAAALHHASIIPIYEVGQDQGVRYFAMEYVDGHDLRREIALQYVRFQRAQVRFDVRESGGAPSSLLLPPAGTGAYLRAVADLVRRVADALQHAHDRGIVHRDVKPQNLLLDADGRVVVADFGIARDEQFGTLTDSDEVFGSVHYMSPEQIVAGASSVDPRSDVYSLGVVLYEALALSRPFEGKTSAEIRLKIQQEDPPPLPRVIPRVPRDLILICEKAMARDVADRYATAGDLRDDLRRFLEHG